MGTSRREGKVVDVWKWRRDDDKLIEVELRLAKVTSQHSLHERERDRLARREEPGFETLRTEFVVIHDDPKFEFTGTDCEALRHAVWAALDKRYAINWTRYYLVIVNPERIYEGQGAGMSFTYRQIEKGVCWDGKELLREDYRRGHQILPWPGEFKNNMGKVEACIPATEDNTKALDEFTKRIHLLREVLAAHLAPARIQQTLCNLAGVPLPLLGIEDKSGKRRRSERRSDNEE